MSFQSESVVAESALAQSGQPESPLPSKAMAPLLRTLAAMIEGPVLTDSLHKTLYATDASAYREIPLGVVVPAGPADLKTIVTFAAEHHLPLIPRGAGTSLAGQVVGSGLVLDMRSFDKILEVNVEEHWVRVQPGVVRNRLNEEVARYGLQFGPETSTANRAFLGGMIGNNSCGAHSMVWGSTRDHLLSCRALLSNGMEVEFGPLTRDAFHRKRALGTLESQIYDTLYRELSDPEMRREMVEGYPKASIRRRNNGYALDLLARSNVFTPDGPDFNMCTVVAGSEGTLCLVTEATLNLVPLPPPVTGCVTMHFHDSIESLRATLVALKYGPQSCELIGGFHVQQALEFRKTNPHGSVAQCSRWIQGEPESIIAVEFAAETRQEIEDKAAALVAELKTRNMGYAWPLWFGTEVDHIWEMRRALGGINSSKPGDIKSCELIEDCAIDVEDQPEYAQELERMLDRAGVAFTHSAHAGDGELHTIVFLNLKTHDGIRLFRQVLENVVSLVKRFRGSLSGEHGDGRLRGEFLPQILGQANYDLCCRIKAAFDPQGIFNPNKIVQAPPMDTSLRYAPDRKPPKITPYFNWDKDLGFIRAVERCNGMAECKRLSGGLMCPSFMATRDEKDSTRARANTLREFITTSTKANPFDYPEIRDVLDLCLSCKGCKSECPASVDMTKLKAEVLQHYYESHRPSLRTQMIAGFGPLMRLASRMAPVFNTVMTNRLLAPVLKRSTGFAVQRSIPTVCRITLGDWYRAHPSERSSTGAAPSMGTPPRQVHLFCDEFTNLNDASIGIAAVKLLAHLGYDVVLMRVADSGRALISKGFLKRAKVLADQNVSVLKDCVNDDAPLIAVEPSTISCFKDEYPDLVSSDLRDAAQTLSQHSLMFEEFIAREMDLGHITADAFTDAARTVQVHVHCHQKALSSPDLVVKVLSLPRNYTVTEIPSGCCGMAGGFGYEADHYELSMRIGEQVLFPAVRACADDVIIAASGTSCRHQIKDGTGRRALHTAEILYQALRPTTDNHAMSRQQPVGGLSLSPDEPRPDGNGRP